MLNKTKKYKCLICQEIFEGDITNMTCPVCFAGEDNFIEVFDEEIKFRNDTDEYFLIIGNGAAGFYAAEAIRERNKTCKIIIITKESELTYFRTAISDKLNEEIDSKFYVVDNKWYSENNINVLLETNVVEIDEEYKTVILDTAYNLKYDKLILANGSNSFVPSIVGNDLENVFTLRNTNDLFDIKQVIGESKRVVVVGGGLLGLEAAWEFKLAGLDVTVINNSSNLLSRQLDEEGSKILKDIVEEAGINLILNGNTERIKGEDKVEKVILQDGKIIDCDIVLLSVGVRANIDIAKSTSIKLERAIVVDEYMQTTSKDIYACGDVAQYRNVNMSIWPIAVEMGKIAGANACGDTIKYENGSYPVFLDAMDSKVFSIGNFTDYDKILYSKDDENKIYKKLFIKDQKLNGAILINDLSLSGKIVNSIGRKEIKDLTDNM